MFACRPSAAGIWVPCAAYAAMAKQFPEQPGDNEVREEGNAGHWAAYEVGNGRPVPVGTIAPNGVEMTDELVDAVHDWLDVLRGWGVPVYMEAPVQAKRIHPTECGGTTDAAGWNAATRTMYVGDLKLGYRQVHPYKNWQLICYFFAFLEYLESQLGTFTEHFNVVFVIFQPRAYGYPALKEWHTTSDKLIDLLPVLQRAAARNVAWPTPMVGEEAACYTPGPHCDGCPGAGNCPGLAQASLAITDLSVDRALTDDHGYQVVAQRLRMLYRARDTLKAEIDGCEARLEFEIRNNHNTVPGFEVSGGPGKLAWLDGVETQVLALGQMLGVSLAKPVKPITPTQAAEAVKHKAPGVTAQFAHRQPGKAKLRMLPENFAEKLFEGK